MRLIIFILLLSLGLGYYVTYHVIKDYDWQWYAYFVTNDLKAFLVSLALVWTTRKTRYLPFATCALSICSYDLIVQILDVNQKGNWAEVIYIMLLSLTMVFFFVNLYARTNH